MKELQIENKSVKKKVAIIGLKGLPAFGGAATVGENLIENLKDKYNFYVYSIETHTKRFAENDGFIQIVFNQFPIKKLNIFIYYCKSAVHCLKNNYDLIHLHHIDGAFIIPILKLKYKIITTSHAQTYLSEKWPAYIKLFFRINERIMLKFSDKVTAVSLQLTNYYESNSSREIFYIPNGINPNIKVDHSPLERNRYLLFAAGRIIPLKGLHTLMSAMKILGNQEDLLVIGDLGQMPAYKQKILEMAKDIEVTFMGLIKNKSVLLNYVRHCILFIFPSYSENMSIMLLEAALMKVPIICSDIDANKAIFNEDEVIFFKSNDSIDLAKKIQYCLDNYQDVLHYSEMAYQKVITLYTWDIIAKRYEYLYNTIIEKKGD